MAAIPFETTLRYIRGLVQRDTSGRQPDRDLVDRASGGDQAAFAELLERHGAMVRGVCLRMLGNGADADDAFQATFLVLARKAGTIRCHESLAGWLYRVAYRLACRARSTTRQRQLHESQAVAPVCADPAAEITWREVRQVIDEELQRQPARYRDPLVLCYLEGHTQEEAARQLGWRVGVLRGRLDRGRQRLRRRLERRGITGAGALGATSWSTVRRRQGCRQDCARRPCRPRRPLPPEQRRPLGRWPWRRRCCTGWRWPSESWSWVCR